jgi:hypothetical protein
VIDVYFWANVGESLANHIAFYMVNIYMFRKKTTIHMQIIALEGGEACGDTQFKN